MRRHALLTIAAALLAACSSRSPTEPPPDSVDFGGSLAGHAELAFGPGAADGPALVVRVIITNVGTGPALLSVTGCSVLARVTVRSPAGTESVFDDGTPPCAAVVTRVAPAPGRSDTLYRTIDFSTLGPNAKSGARLTAEARFAGRTMHAGSIAIP